MRGGGEKKRRKEKKIESIKTCRCSKEPSGAFNYQALESIVNLQLFAVAENVPEKRRLFIVPYILDITSNRDDNKS